MYCAFQQITEDQTSLLFKKMIQLIMEHIEKQSFGEVFNHIFAVLQTRTGGKQLYTRSDNNFNLNYIKNLGANA